jgi:hypothetical protein
MWAGHAQEPNCPATAAGLFATYFGFGKQRISPEGEEICHLIEPND